LKVVSDIIREEAGDAPGKIEEVKLSKDLDKSQ
jgi:hypothetical protein